MLGAGLFVALMAKVWCHDITVLDGNTVFCGKSLVRIERIEVEPTTTIAGYEAREFLVATTKGKPVTCFAHKQEGVFKLGECWINDDLPISTLMLKAGHAKVVK